MDDRLSVALVPVLRDLDATGVPRPRFADDDWGLPDIQLTAMMWAPDGSGAGVSVHLSETAAESVVRAADMVQEFVIETLWAAGATNWPPCPAHPATHPLRAQLVDDVPSWVCPTGSVTTPIGALRPPADP